LRCTEILKIEIRSISKIAAFLQEGINDVRSESKPLFQQLPLYPEIHTPAPARISLGVSKTVKIETPGKIQDILRRKSCV
jgi:hypothetical protein